MAPLQEVFLLFVYLFKLIDLVFGGFIRTICLQDVNFLRIINCFLSLIPIHFPILQQEPNLLLNSVPYCY